MIKPALKSSLVMAAVIALWVVLPYTVQATSSGARGVQISLNGYLFFLYGSESCSTQQTVCTPGESVIPYLALANGNDYILIGGNLDIWPSGTKMLVTGWLVPPTVSSTSLSFTGGIIVTSIYAHCYLHHSVAGF